MNRVVKYTVSILLAVTILTMSFSVFAVDPSPVPTFTGDNIVNIDEAVMSYYIWLCMRAWGIDISYNQSLDWQVETGQMINQWVLEYLDSLPSAYSISTWIAPWQAGLDYWGNFQGNSSMLEDVADFVEWLVDKLSLSDNSSVDVITPGYSVANYKVYQTPVVLTSYDNSGHLNLTTITSESTAYVLFCYTSTNQYRNVSFVPFALTDDVTVKVDATGYFPSNKTLNLENTDASIFYTVPNIGVGIGNQGGYINFDGIEIYTVTYNGQFLNPASSYNASSNNWKGFWDQYNSVDYVDSNVAVLTYTLNLPTEGVDYTTGDSIVIINNSPSYQVIQWDDIKVSNLPAVVSTGKVENPGIIEFFRPISALIDMAKTPFDIMVQIIYRFPVEVNVCIMSLMGAICLFGIIKIMREH